MRKFRGKFANRLLLPSHSKKLSRPPKINQYISAATSGAATDTPITQKYLRGTFERSIHSEIRENTQTLHIIAAKIIVNRAAK